MQQRFKAPVSARTFGGAALTIATLALAACGGDGGDSATATVTSMSVAATKYGTPALVTIVGTHLGNLNLQAPGCKNVTRLTAAPTASSDTTAYFQCTPSGAYTSTISAISNGGTVGSQPLMVAAPIVTMTVTGGPSASPINGTIVFNLKGNVAPITVDNFLAYVNSGTSPTNGFYVGTIFHRVVDFNNPQASPEYDVIQGGTYGAATGGTLPAAKTGTFAPIALETSGGTNVQWTAAMARTSDANSATSGFFFNVKNNTGAFDTASGPGYAVFADVSGSSAILTQIAAIAQGGTSVCPTLVGINDGSCVPVPNVTITSAAQTQ
jgi:cyclophilin family peptidyl-prolyl cis-trans isomerase